MTPNLDDSILLSDEEFARFRDLANMDERDVLGMIQAAGVDSAAFSSFMREMGVTDDPAYEQVLSLMKAVENQESSSLDATVEAVTVAVSGQRVRVYVGNLPSGATEALVRRAFESFGHVESVALINDRETGKPRGFGFVSMPSVDAEVAIANLDGADFLGRPIKVYAAQDAVRATRQGEMKNN